MSNVEFARSSALLRLASIALSLAFSASALRADFVTFVIGATSPAQFTLQVTNVGVSGVSFGVAPAPGTPAYGVLNGNVNFTAGLPVLGTQAVLGHVMTQLNPNRRYSFKGTAVRGGGYLDRWTLFELGEARSFASAHTSNCLTFAHVPSIASNQVAINTGANSTAGTGDIFDWEDVQPSAAGVVVIYSRQYTGPVPGGSSAGSLAYGLVYFRVEEFGTNIGPATITKQPQSILIGPGGTTNLSVQAHAFGGPVYYQWLKDGVAISGATSNTLKLTSISSNHVGLYSVVVSNEVSSVTSSNAELTLAPVVITQQPVNQVAAPGMLLVNFSVTANAAGGPVYYQWFKDGQLLVGSRTRTHNISRVNSNHAGFYYVVVSNAISSVTSSGAELVLAPPEPTVLVHPTNQLVFEGRPVTLSVSAVGSPPLALQWQRDGTNVIGATSNFLVFSSIKGSNEGIYRVALSNQYGTAFSSNALLEVITYAEALNCTNLVWNPWSVQAPRWVQQNQVTHDGSWALKTYPGMDGSITDTTVQSPCFLSFWWKLSAPDSVPEIRFSAGYYLLATLKGEVDWRYEEFYLGSNTPAPAWTLFLNGTPNADRVTAYLDEVTYIPGGQKPLIVSPPKNRVVAAGEQATFRVSAKGHQPFRYQWQHAGLNLPDATNSTLIVTNAHAEAAGTYAVIVSNDHGDATTSASLVVAAVPVFMPQTTDLFTIEGGEVWLHARVRGQHPMSYQWKFQGVAIPGETDAVLKLHRIGTNQLGHYQVVARNELDETEGPDLHVRLTQVRHVVHVSLDGLGAVHLVNGLRDDPNPERFPTFVRFLEEGACTLNARCDYTNSYTVPNHLSMLTGRPVGQPSGQPATVPHGYFGDYPYPYETIHGYGNTNVPYKASVFDVAHDHGLSTAFIAGKSTLGICAVSYTDTNGAPDLLPPDHGSNKIDLVHYATTWASSLVDALVGEARSGRFYHYTFLHLRELDSTGHRNGWGSTNWYSDLAYLDAQLERVFSVIETNAVPALAGQTVVLLTADHGGGGDPGGIAGHSDETSQRNYTIPLLAWGPGFPAGADLYSLFSNRTDPDTNCIDYSSPWQPLRNGDSGNLAMLCLGLPFIPGSSMQPVLESDVPRLYVSMQGNSGRLSWSRAACEFLLEATDSVDPIHRWTPIVAGIATNSDSFVYPLNPEVRAQFFRLRRIP